MELVPVARGDEAAVPVSYLVCEISGIHIGVEALAVREITPLPAWTPVPGMAPLVAGVVDVRGEFVPVIDIAAATGLPILPPAYSDALILVEHDGAAAAIAVGAVLDVQPLVPRPFSRGEQLSGESLFTDQGSNTAVSAGTGEVHGDEAESESEFCAGLAALDHLVVQILSTDAIVHPERSRTRSTLTLELADPVDLEVFQQRARTLASTSELAVADDSLELAVVMLEGERFGLELRAVREFASLRTVTPVPRAPSHILGLINLRGETLPLVDPRLALGLEPVHLQAGAAGHSQVVVIENSGVRAGLVVDEVLDVRRAPMAELRAHAARSERDPLRATWMDGEGLMGVLDAERLLGGGEN